MWWKSPYGYSKLCNINTHEKLIHRVAIFTILYGNYYPPHREFKLICIGKFSRRAWVNFTQQYGKNRQRCEKNNFTMLYDNYCYNFIENFPQKFSPCTYNNSHVSFYNTSSIIFINISHTSQFKNSQISDTSSFPDISNFVYKYFLSSPCYIPPLAPYFDILYFTSLYHPHFITFTSLSSFIPNVFLLLVL